MFNRVCFTYRGRSAIPKLKQHRVVRVGHTEVAQAFKLANGPRTGFRARLIRRGRRFAATGTAAATGQVQQKHGVFLECYVQAAVGQLFVVVKTI